MAAGATSDSMRDAARISALERVARGFSSQRRIRILLLLMQQPAMDLAQISRALRAMPQNASEHTRRMVSAGLIVKTRSAQRVMHSLSPLGQTVAKFLQELRPPG